jgi:DNA (cytosine-5)-methyltransferase 1
MPRAYYNEIDPYAAQWLRNLIEAGHIAKGDVDERSIEDVAPSDLKGYTQCHFFAGIGVWSYALRLNQWPDKRQVWTGSCPCQPFSAVGKGKGFDDERHLWPAFHWLIRKCRPAIVFGEQVASKNTDTWIDLVSTDLEGLDFAFAAAAFPSAGIGAPHIRDRAYWVAPNNRVAYTNSERQQRGRTKSGIVVVADRQGRETNAKKRHGPKSGVASFVEQQKAVHRGLFKSSPNGANIEARPTNGFWKDVDWLACRDGKWRPVEPGTFPLADGTSSRVGRLRAYGNDQRLRGSGVHKGLTSCSGRNS